jgi:hypothetical protein
MTASSIFVTFGLPPAGLPVAVVSLMEILITCSDNSPQNPGSRQAEASPEGLAKTETSIGWGAVNGLSEMYPSVGYGFPQ